MRAQAPVFLSSLLAIPLASVTPAQTPTTTIVRWQSGAPDSDLIVRNGLQIVILDQEGLSVRVTLTAQDNRQLALVGVINQTEGRVEVIPSEFALELVRPEEKQFRYQDPDMLAEKARSVAALEEVLAGMLSYQRSYTTGAVHGTTFYSTTTTYPNVSGTALAAAGQAKEGEASAIERGALRENTLLPGERVSGAVFFRAPKHYDRDYRTGRLEAVLTVPIGRYLFQLPFYWDGWATAKHEKALIGKGYYIFEFPTRWKAKK